MILALRQQGCVPWPGPTVELPGGSHRVEGLPWQRAHSSDRQGSRGDVSCRDVSLAESAPAATSERRQREAPETDQVTGAFAYSHLAGSTLRIIPGYSRTSH
jgi:hypothetical protein